MNCTRRTRQASKVCAFFLLAAAFVSGEKYGNAQSLKLLAQNGQGLNASLTNPYFTVPDANGTWAGSVTSQADSVMGANSARTTFGVTGAGVKIGIISDSYNFLGGAAGGVLSGDLPGPGNPNNVTPITIVNDDLAVGRTDEGRAMAELIHDLAPGAQLFFHSAFNNAETSPGGTIATAINNLVAQGVDIIVDDVFNMKMPYFQDGASAQAADAAFAAGIPYFSSAGNSANNSYAHSFNGTGAGHPMFGGANIHDFDPGVGVDTILDIGTLAAGAQVRATLWWDDPYPTVGGAPTSNFDFGIVDVTNNVLAQVSVANQLGGVDAFEFVNIVNPFAAPISVGLVVDGFAGDLAKGLKILVIGTSITDPNDTNSPTVFGHNSAKGAIAVAAHSYVDPGLDDVEPFSSEGPTTILFDAVGNRLVVPELRNTPQITGADGTDTTFFFPGVDSEPNGFPNFFGTSAAAPHVAAIAALVMERATNMGINLTPSQLYQILFNSTIDIESAGFDNLSGYGRLDAYAAVSAIVPEPGTLTLLALVGWIAATNGRWRRR